MTFGEALRAQWFEVVDGGVIVFAGPLEHCGDYVTGRNGTGNNGHALTIRISTF